MINVIICLVSYSVSVEKLPYKYGCCLFWITSGEDNIKWIG